MPKMLNPFSDNPAWDETELTDAINKRPVVSRDVSNDLGWEEKGVNGKTVTIDQKESGIDIVDDAAYNGVPGEIYLEDPNAFELRIRSHPMRSVVKPEEVAGRRAFGTEADPETVEMRRTEHLDKHVASHNLSHEVDRIGALQGAITRRDGSVKTDLASAFGVTPAALELDFNNVDEDYTDKFLEFKDQLEEAAGDLMVEGWLVYAPTLLFRKITQSKRQKAKYLGFLEGLRAANADVRKGFDIAEGVVIKQYSPNFQIPDSGGRHAFPTDTLIMAPIAAGNYQTRFAPRQDLVTIGDMGLPMYVKTKVLDLDEGLLLHSESNHIHYVRRLEAIGLIKQSE